MRRNLCILLVCALFLVGMLPALLVPSPSNFEDTFESVQSNQTPQNPIDDSTTILSDSQKTGIIEPLAVEQRGYVSTGIVSIRNDMTLNIEDSLSIDTTHDWVGSLASVEVSELEKLYALNGTFEEGVPGINDYPNCSVAYHPLGWDANSTDTATYSDDVQLAAYDASGSKYVTVESQGGKVGQDRYGHAAGTKIVWTQTVQNTPYTEDFNLNFDYFYLRGPIDGPDGLDPVVGNCSLVLFANGVNVWNMSLLLLSQRGVWFSTGDIPLHINGISSSFKLEIGLVIDESLVLNYKTADYDGDPAHLVDGVGNAAYITAFLDDVSFTALTPPTPESVELTFHAGDGFAAIAGTSGSGTAVVSNSSYWDSDILDISFSSNTSISFIYDVSLLSHRFSNSTWINEVDSEGTSYQVSVGHSSAVEAYSYIGSAAEYTNNSLTLNFPSDWKNITILDPFLTNATGECDVTSNKVVIPDLLFSRLGWWQFTANTPNYAKDLKTQISGPQTSDWANESIFRSMNYTRATLEIGAVSQEPSSLSNVEVSWHLPNDTLWYSEAIDSPSGNTLNSSSLYLASENTTAGQWMVSVFWENGTEIAYDLQYFEIHHMAELVAENALIETKAGSVITNMIRYVDIETNEYIMEAGTTLVANWSELIITFQPNPVHNWWEANFDTSILGGGQFLVRVNGSSTYYDSAVTTFLIYSILTDNTLHLAESSSSVSLAQNYSAEFTYLDQFGVGIESADFGIDYEGPTGGLSWGDVVDLGSGNYYVNISASVSDSYTITINASRTFYEEAIGVLVLDVGTLDATLQFLNGTVDSIGFGQSYRLVLKYENGTGYGLPGASVSIVNTVPSYGISNSSATDLGDGYYSIILTPTVATTYSILFEAEIANHDREVLSFTLSVTDIATTLTIESSDNFIAIDQNSTIVLHYTNETGHGIEGADISIISPPSGLTYSSFSDLGDGFYMVRITPLLVGEYQLRFLASADNHLEATSSAALSVSLVRTSLVIETPLAEYSSIYNEKLQIPLVFQRLDQSGIPIANISDAYMQIVVPTDSNILWTLAPELVHPGHYVLLLWGDSIGTWDVSILANKSNHEDAALTIHFSVNEIATDINTFNSVDCIFNRTYLFTFEYVFELNSTLIEGANLSVSGTGSEFISWNEDSTGYSVVFVPLDTGTYTINIDFEKEGYQIQSGSLGFEVIRVPITIRADSSATWDEVAPLEIELSLVVSDTLEPVNDALVTCTIYSSGSFIREFRMDSLGNGTYYVQIPSSDWQDPDIIIEVAVQKPNYQPVTHKIDVNTRPATILERMIANSIPLTGFSFLFIVSVVAVSSYRKRQMRLRMSALEIKSRFDDANNLLGILILHKNSGLPFYSKILKGGFEEGMLSAFVTAVTHFRSEFNQNETEADREWKLTPISDIIRAGRTRNMICAFVTLTSPSLAQEARMLSFTREIGMLLDGQMEVPPSEFRDDKTGQIIEDLFNLHVDGFLLQKYRIPMAGALPRKFKDIKNACAIAGLGDVFTLTELSRGLEASGMDDTRGYNFIFNAIDEGLIWPINKLDDIEMS